MKKKVDSQKTDTNEYEHNVWIGEDVTPRVLNNDDRDEDDGYIRHGIEWRIELKGCVCYIFTSLFCMPKREDL